MRPFVYERPHSLLEAHAILAADPSAVPLAGGTDLIIGLRDGSIRPDRVVDLKRVAELDDRIEIRGDRLVIGALAVMEDIANHPRIRRDFTALAEAAAYVGSVQIRNRATLPGNICNASPAADTLPALLVYGALVACSGPDGERVSRSTNSSWDPEPPPLRVARSSRPSSCPCRPSGWPRCISDGREGADMTWLR